MSEKNERCSMVMFMFTFYLFFYLTWPIPLFRFKTFEREYYLSLLNKIAIDNELRVLVSMQLFLSYFISSFFLLK